MGLAAVTENILSRLHFILGVEEDWDSYSEAEARFVRFAISGGETHYVFLTAGKEYWITPRYLGQSIESVTGGGEIIVNVSAPASRVQKNKRGQALRPIGTGVIRVRDPA
jgi:hypothetical protein